MSCLKIVLPGAKMEESDEVCREYKPTVAETSRGKKKKKKQWMKQAENLKIDEDNCNKEDWSNQLKNIEVWVDGEVKFKCAFCFVLF